MQPALLADMGRYRHQVFVEKLGWPLRCENSLEYDQFDRPDTVYVLKYEDRGHVGGFARLLPTTSPYLLSEVFSPLMGGQTMPSSPDIWELSRFTTMAPEGVTGASQGQFSSPHAADFLSAVLDCAQRHGARKLITVSPLGVERLLRKAGFEAERAGPPMTMGGHTLFACWIHV